MIHRKFEVQQIDVPQCEIEGCTSWQQFEIGYNGLIVKVVCGYHIERAINDLNKEYDTMEA